MELVNAKSNGSYFRKDKFYENNSKETLIRFMSFHYIIFFHIFINSPVMNLI